MIYFWAIFKQCETSRVVHAATAAGTLQIQADVSASQPVIRGKIELIKH